MTDLPPLPNPRLEEHEHEAWEQNMRGNLYTVAQLVAYAVAAEREACAKVCEETTAAWTQHLYNEACMNCAAAIRARGENGPEF